MNGSMNGSNQGYNQQINQQQINQQQINQQQMNQQQRNQQINQQQQIRNNGGPVNAYNTGMTNPAAAFQNMQQQSGYGSQAFFVQPQMGSNRNLATAMQQQNVYNKQLPNNPCMSYICLSLYLCFLYAYSEQYLYINKSIYI